MTENPPGPTDPLDVQRIHYLVRLMKRYDLTAVDLTDGSVQIRLRRRTPLTSLAHAAGEGQGHVTAGPNLSSNIELAPARIEPPAAVTAAPRTVVIESPMVGTYYASSAPDTPPFVLVGSTVEPDTIVCIIEAMKVFTDIPAGVSGTIAEILVKNGQAVEFSQPLFRVIPS
jgi:acetyl-CoA carboxylase biotin carboxyl carrier protein